MVKIVGSPEMAPQLAYCTAANPAHTGPEPQRCQATTTHMGS